MSAIIDHFGSLSDLRTKEYKVEHKLIDIIFITIAGVSDNLFLLVILLNVRQKQLINSF